MPDPYVYGTEVIKEEIIISEKKNILQSIEDGVVGAYKKVENGVVGAYKAVEKGAVKAYEKVEDVMVEKLFAKEDESVEDAKKRLQNGQK